MNRLASDQAQLYEFVAPRARKAGEKNEARKREPASRLTFLHALAVPPPKISSKLLQVSLFSLYEQTNIPGALEVSSASFIVWTDTCDKSTNIPSRFISSTTS